MLVYTDTLLTIIRFRLKTIELDRVAASPSESKVRYLADHTSARVTAHEAVVQVPLADSSGI